MTLQWSKCYAFILLAILIFEIIGTMKSKKDDDCIREDFNVICEHSIPDVVPTNVSGVVIKDYLQETIYNGTFAHESWLSVDVLDITVRHYVGFNLPDSNIFPSNLQNLGIHSPRLLLKNNTYIFEGLPRLHTLNLSSCYYLKASDIVTMLSKLRNLDALILDQVATFGERLLILDNTFFKTVSLKEFRKLSMSGCNLMIKGPFYVIYPHLVLYNLDVSNTSIVSQGFVNVNEIVNLFTSNLKILDMSHIQSRYIGIDYEFLDTLILDNRCAIPDVLFRILTRIEHLKINEILSERLRANNSFLNFSECKISLKSIQMRSNHIRYLNMSILWPDNINLFEFDLSSNGLEYLSPSFLGSLASLKIVKLSDNTLYRMKYFNEFQYMFSKHKNLEHLDFSMNHLTDIPFKMFSYNTNLIILDLSYNKLTTIRFELKHLKKLQFLNLRHNDIQQVESVNLNSLKLFVAHSSKDLKIHFENNPLVCKCESSSFIKWLHVYMINAYNRSLTCSFEDKDDVIINTTVIEESLYSCIRLKLIIASITAALLVIFVVSMATIIIFYKRRQKKRIIKRGNFLKNFKLGSLPEKYLCFTSYSSDDDEKIIQQINSLIKQSLQDLIHTDKEVLCDSDKHFNIGFPIIDEVIRCICESCVGIFFVTHNFCQSHWCEMELRETYDLQKPIILVFKEEIDENNMSPVMLNIFRKFTRAKIIVTEDGQIQMMPDVKQLSNSIIKLASLRYVEDIELN